MTIDAQRHSEEMASQRAQELAGDDRHYRLRKACVARAVDLYNLLCASNDASFGKPNPFGYDLPIVINQLLKEIEHDAQ